MPAVLLDTNCISDLMRGHVNVVSRFDACVVRPATSVITQGEIRFGLERIPIGKKRAALELRAGIVLAAIAVEPITTAIADEYGKLKSTIIDSGLNPSDNDLWIAATAIATKSLIVTRDRFFAKVQGLVVEDWTL